MKRYIRYNKVKNTIYPPVMQRGFLIFQYEPHDKLMKQTHDLIFEESSRGWRKLMKTIKSGWLRSIIYRKGLPNKTAINGKKCILPKNLKKSHEGTMSGESESIDFQESQSKVCCNVIQESRSKRNHRRNVNNHSNSNIKNTKAKKKYWMHCLHQYKKQRKKK